MTHLAKIKRVVVCAYACEPGKGSEPEVGWKWVDQISRFAEVWVVTRSNNRNNIETVLKANPNSNLNFVYADLPKWARGWKKGGRGVRLYYFLWQFCAISKFKELNKVLRFDLCHHLTFVNDWIPSLFSFLPVPFVWGPIGSNGLIPPHFLPSKRAFALEVARVTTQILFRVINPLFWLSLYRARVVIGIDRKLADRFPFRLFPKTKFLYQPAIAMENLDICAHDNEGGEKIKILMVGRLIYIKGFHLGIEAFARVAKKYPQATLEILGEGMELEDLKRRTQLFGVSDSVRFSGNVSRADVLRKMSDCDIFLFPSFEGGGFVVLEAMSSGKPVVCLDFGGPGEMVTEECGIKVAVTNYVDTVQGLSRALCSLIDSPDLRKKMGDAGALRIKSKYSWELKQTFIKNVYMKALNLEDSLNS